MRLPDWIPETPRPFWQDKVEAWEAMTANERRWSFVIDVIFCVIFVAVIVFFNVAYPPGG
jgi:hypothetical protein